MEQNGVTRTGASVMWWGDGPPVASHTLMTRIYPGRELHYYPGWEQFQYLPLAFGKEYATGFTVYLDFEFSGVIGIVSHGPSDFVFGKAVYFEDKDEEPRPYPGVPIHFTLSPGEYLTSAWFHLEPMQSIGQFNGMLVVGFFIPTLEDVQI